MSEEGSRREEGLKQQVAQLRHELEQEKNAKKEMHRDKVREMKTLREKEQTSAREHLENLKVKLQREKNQELQTLRDNLTKELKVQMKSVQKRHEEELTAAQKEWKKEKQEMRDKLRKELQEQIQNEVISRSQLERKKLTQEMFELESQRKAAEDRVADYVAADRTKSELIRERESAHRSEIERIQRSARISSKQQLQELEEGKRRMVEKDRELAQVQERLRRTQADKDSLEDEVQRLRQAESWARATSPVLSPSTSTEELATKQAYTKRERDMLIRNSELTFRVRRVEEINANIEQQNKELQERLQEAESANRPMKEQITKLNHRINELNVALRSREKQVKQLSEENLDLKSSKQQLEEEHSRQRRSLKHQLSQGSVYRAEKEKLTIKNRELAETTMSLYSRMDQLEQQNMSLCERLSSSLPTSPVPLPTSPVPGTAATTDYDGDFGSQVSLLGEGSREQLDQLEFEKEESRSKYEELKTEYVGLREKYKGVTSKYERLQNKAREQFDSYKLVQASFEQLRKEKLYLEREVALLRSRKESQYDVEREQKVQEETQRKLQKAEGKISELESFIIEQDAVLRKQEEFHKKQESKFLEEKLQLLSENHELQETVNGAGEARRMAAADVEDSNARVLQEIQARNEELEAQQKYHTTELEDASVTIEWLQNQVAVVQQEKEALEKQLASSEASLILSQTQHETSQTQHETSQTQHETSQTQQETSQTQHETSQTQHETSQTQHETRESELLNGGLGIDDPDASGNQLDIDGLDKLQQWIQHYQNELTQVKEENFDLKSRLSLAHEKVLALQSTAEELESRLDIESGNNNATLMEKEDEITQLNIEVAVVQQEKEALEKQLASGSGEQLDSEDDDDDDQMYATLMEKENEITQLKVELSHMESKLTRLRRAVTVGVNQQMNRQLGQNVLSCINKVKNATRSGDELQALEAATTELLQTVFPGEFETHTQGPEEATQGLEDAISEENEEGPPSPPPSPISIPNEDDQVQLNFDSSTPLQAPTPPKSPLPPDETLLPSERKVRLFLAVMDYDPVSLCTTGKPEDEITLPTGAIIQVHGDMDKNAYYRATFEGQTGLIPANFVQEMTIADHSAHQRLVNQTLSRSFTPSRGVTPVNTQAALPNYVTQETVDASLNYVTQETVAATSPFPPTNLHVEKALGESVLLVAWSPPSLDRDGRSNGSTVCGYQLYLNGEPGTTATGPTQNKVLVAGLNLSDPLTIGISTLSKEGSNSDTISINYLGLPPKVARISSNPEVYRLFMVLYDYDPVKCSPSDNPEFELSLKEGNLVKVFGKEMSDGFLVGELSGRRGLVPAAFVTEVAGSDADKRQSWQSLDTSLPATSKRMVAAFDYSTTQDSPNFNPELELSFKKGDVITIYGNMDTDGFYCGELGGKFGLVPSNLLQQQEEASMGVGSPDPPTDTVATLEVETVESEKKSQGVLQDETSTAEHTESLPPSSGKKGRKHRKHGFSLGKQWVKSAFTRKKAGSTTT